MAGTSHVSSNTIFAADVTVLGTTTLTGAHSHTGNFAVNTDKFTVAAASGNTAVAGTLNVTGAATFFSTVVRASQKYIISAANASKAGAGAGWTVAAADNLALVTMAASQTAGTLIIPITGLKVGATITAIHLVGQIESAGGAVTVDMDIRKMTAAAADVTDASLDTMTQLSVSADTIMSSANTSKTLTTPEVLAADEVVYVKLTATTAGSTDIALMSIAVTVTEA
jgi:hypothetical protein